MKKLIGILLTCLSLGVLATGSEYYNHTTFPAQGTAATSASMRAELDLVMAGFGKLPTLAGNGSKICAINSGGTSLEAITAVAVAQGGTGRSTSTTAYGLIAAGTTATGAHQTLAAGATTEVLVGGGASALPVWTAATGSGSPVRATSPTLVTPDLGTPSALVGTNITGTAAGLTAGAASAVAVGGVTGLGTGVATFLATPSSANLKTALTDETGSGAAVFANTPTLVTPVLGAATATSINGVILGRGTTGVSSNLAVDGLPGFGVSTTGIRNIAIGSGVLNALTSGSGNVAIGYLAGWSGLSTGSNNVFIGNEAGYYIAAATNTNSIAIGYQANPSTNSASNEITLGNSSISTIRAQVTSITSLSDRRDKKDIEPLPTGLTTIMALKPVRFTWAMRDGGKVGIKDAGFIAQDLQTVDDPWLRLVYAENPEKLEASYGRLLPVLVKAIQDLKQEFDEYRRQHP